MNYLSSMRILMTQRLVINMKHAGIHDEEIAPAANIFQQKVIALMINELTQINELIMINELP